jgi:phospholipid/cholesterol/gamma-HCH transport system ATP-binding protein
LKLIVALIKPDAGHIWIDGEDITRLEGKELSRVRQKMGFLFQNAALFDFLTLYNNLALPLRRLTHKTDQEIDEIIDRVLHQVGLGGDREKMPLELSGGMKKRAGLARAVVLEPEILMVDEPSSALDRITASEIDDLPQPCQSRPELPTCPFSIGDPEHRNGPAAGSSAPSTRKNSWNGICIVVLSQSS